MFRPRASAFSNSQLGSAPPKECGDHRRGRLEEIRGFGPKESESGRKSNPVGAGKAERGLNKSSVLRDRDGSARKRGD